MQNQLQSAYQDLQNHQPKVALSKLQEMQLHWPHNSDVAHLLALAHKALGDVEQAMEQFERSLNINQQQPEVHNNLANLLKSQADYQAAEEHYRIALKFDPKYLQAWRNLAICQHAQTRYESAIEAFLRALELAPNDPSCLTGLADSHRAAGDYERAHYLYQKVLKMDPKRVLAWHNLGLNHHLQGELNQALECYRHAYSLAGEKPEYTQSLALCLHELGQTRAAIELFETALRKYPDNLDLHERFNGMLWESEFSSQFGESYRAAIARRPANQQLVTSFASLLFRAGLIDQARSVLDSLTEPHSEVSDTEADLLALRGKIAAELGDFDVAYHALSASLETVYSKDIAQQLIKIDIVLARYSQAQALLNVAFESAPDCQLNWALQSLVWRLSDDERYEWLMDYRQFVKVYRLEVPPPYANLQDFLKDLELALNPLHRTEKEPLLQTLRNGTQTAPRLLHSPDPRIKLLKESLQKIVETYLARLPVDSEHPFLSRKGERFEFAGSWSVKLRPNGFHINHVHTDGWISSSCYISIPHSMQEAASDPSSKQGCIKFGESPLQLGDREVVEMCVRPEPGMVVLFPSYCWHGTFPFDGDDSDYRMTAPFDILPNK